MESFVADLKTQVLCSLCSHRMVEPKLLECFHTFCQLCIKTNSQLDGQVNVFKCPQCGSLSEFEELNDVDDLQTNPIHARILQSLSFVESQSKVCSASESHHDEAIWQCLDCHCSLCDECLTNHSIFKEGHKVVSLSEITKVDIEAFLIKENPCIIHDKKLVLYCNDCNELICSHCVTNSHNNHFKSTIPEAIEAKKDSLSQKIKEIESDKKGKNLQQQIALQIKKDGERAKKKVKNIVKEYIKQLLDQEQKLLSEIREKVTRAERNLRTMRHTPAAKEYIKSVLQNGTECAILEIQSQITLEQFDYEPFDMCIRGMTFQVNKDLCDQVYKGMGKITCKTDQQLISQHVPQTTLKETTPTIPGNKVSDDVTQTLNDVMQQDDAIPQDDVITGDDKMSTTSAPCQSMADVQALCGLPVCGSPSKEDVQPQVIEETFVDTKFINALKTGSSYFSGIAVNAANTKIAIVDCGNYCIRVYDMEGEHFLTFCNDGSDSLAFLNDSDLIISESGDHRISILNTNSGHLVRTFGSHGDGEGQFYYPCGVAVDDDSNIIVCDNFNHRIQVFTETGDYRYQFTTPGMLSPYGVVTHNGLVYVSACLAVYVIKLTDNHSSTLVTTIGEQGNADVWLTDPRGLAIDNDHNLWVADIDQIKVHKYSLDGCHIASTNELRERVDYLVILKNGLIICTTDCSDILLLNTRLRR